MARKQTKSLKQQPVKTIIGIAWYRPEQWQRLREVSADRESLHDTYTEWLVEATIRRQELQKMGFLVRKIVVDVEELVQWCGEQQCPVNGEARSMFVAQKNQQLGTPK